MQRDALSAAERTRGTLFVALSACGFASIPTFVVLGTRSGTPLVELLIGRYAIASVLLTGIAWIAGTRRLQREGFRVLVIIGMAQATIAWTSLLALQYITAGALSFLFYTYPAWVAIIARVRHSEPLTGRRLLALALSLGGVLVMVGWPSSGTMHATGVTLALVSALIYAGYVPLIGELQRGLPPPATAAYMAVGTAIVFLSAKVLSDGAGFHYTPVAIRSALGLAVVSTTLSFMLFLSGLRILGALRTAIISTIEPFCTALLAARLLGQPVSSGTFIGGSLIAAAVVLLQFRGGGNDSADAGRSA